MKFNILPPQEYLRQCFVHLPNGDLIWLTRPRNHFPTESGYFSSFNFAGSCAGRPDGQGYLQVSISYNGKSKRYQVHRVIWTMHNGEIPEGYLVDHEDTNRQNNKIGNLRLAIKSNNQHNSKRYKNNTSGVKGVCLLENGKWSATVTKQKVPFVSYHSTIEEATLAVQSKRVQLCEQFTNHGL